MITDGKKCHYLAVNKLSALITSNNNGDLCCLNYFHSYNTKNKLEKHEKVCNDLDNCYVEMPEKNNQILKYNHGEKLMKSLFIIYANLERLLKKMHSCQNNPKKLSTAKINMHTPSGYSLFTNCSFDSPINKLDCYTGKDCMEKFCKNLKELAIKIINYKKMK